MKVKNTNAHLVQFNETIEKWVNFLDDYTLETLCLQPQPGSWSLGQVYMHIINDTNYFIEQMQAALLTTANSEKEMHDDAKAIFSNNGFPAVMIDGPATNTVIAQPQSKDELLLSMWAIQTKVNKLHFTADFSTSAGKTMHPGLLYFSAAEWLQFAEMHMRRHLMQKKRIDEKLFLGKTQ